MAEEKKLTVFPVGITEKEIKKIADQAIEDSGAANEVPLATIADAGKVIKVGDDGKYELAEESGGGGSDLPMFVLDTPIDYEHYANIPTIQDLIDLVGGTVSSGTLYNIFLTQAGDGIFNNGLIVFAKNPASGYDIWQDDLQGKTRKLKHYDGTSSSMASASSSKTYYFIEYNLPSLPTTTESKTYTLKYVNGSLTWVEDNA